MALPQPEDLSSLVLRADFSDDAKWRELQEAIEREESGEGDGTFVSDRAYEGVTVQALVEEDAAADEEEKVTYLFLADAVTMADAEHLLLAVDLFEEPGRTFRVPPRWFPGISANLSIANMDFAEFADDVDAAGVFRGFKDG
ncbi:DUF6924 domain-containing protein [Actinomadura rupiterrae]|uniref:DUF6924 domain-containing protein n=1 Tax=Actinomadura rupiterrae TaxID=559627 RepID=UPI0020A589E4|nr:hypothetical protein [Actinomadura rupiterrae]MCP2339408.1 hypothetical protein [Actinomadura rupiterrae]